VEYEILAPSQGSWNIEGQISEKDARLTIAGKSVRLKPNDAFRHFVGRDDLAEGLWLEARDEAGNVTRCWVVSTLTLLLDGAAWRGAGSTPDGRCRRQGEAHHVRRILGAGFTLQEPPEEEGWQFPRYRHEATGMEFALLPGGTFSMGSRHDGEAPPHPVCLPRPFLLGRREVTQEAWCRFGAFPGCERPAPDFPVADVTFDEALAWCRNAGLDLPSEAEWEYACRAGSAAAWSHGDDAEALGLFACVCGDASRAGTLAPNRWGLYDMHGNVEEWCLDDEHENYLGAPEDGSPWGFGKSKSRMVRGGHCGAGEAGCRSAARCAHELEHRSMETGFRAIRRLPRDDAWLPAPGERPVVLGVEVLPDEACKGLRIGLVAPGSPAARTGLRPGDLLWRVDRRRTRQPGDLHEALRGLRRGDVVGIVVQREGERLEGPLTLAP
jgi:formylglycine-generating enzyme required for sulfatase activity